MAWYLDENKTKNITILKLSSVWPLYERPSGFVYVIIVILEWQHGLSFKDIQV